MCQIYHPSCPTALFPPHQSSGEVEVLTAPLTQYNSCNDFYSATAFAGEKW